MKYILIYQKKSDLFSDEYENKDDAIRQAEIQWNKLTSAEQRSCTAFYVLESLNPDEGAINHYDGNLIAKYK